MTVVLIPTTWYEPEIETKVDSAIAAKQTAIKLTRLKLDGYNGFEGELRDIANWKQKVAKELGLIPVPAFCSVCGTTEGKFDYHNEDYSRPFRTAAICKSCHGKLHRRSQSSNCAATWQSLVKANGDGTKWFESI